MLTGSQARLIKIKVTVTTMIMTIVMEATTRTAETVNIQRCSTLRPDRFDYKDKDDVHDDDDSDENNKNKDVGERFGYTNW